MIYHFDTVTSTNDVAREPQYVHGDIIRAEFQTAGRGQRGHVWSSDAGANLMFTAVVCPTFLPVREQFLLSETVALALTETFAQFGIETRIKWTNDIYAGDRKIAGVLIEQNVTGSTISRSLVGVGINVNQTRFDPALPNPVSMAQLLGHEVERDEVLESFRNNLNSRYMQLQNGDRAKLAEEYRTRMYRLGVAAPFRMKDGTLVHASIEGVAPSGALILRHTGGMQREYAFGEVEFIIANGCAFGK